MKYLRPGFPPPLRISLPLLILVFSLGVVFINAILLFRSDRKLEEERVQNNALHKASRMAEMLGPHSDGQGEPLQRELTFLRRDPNVNWAVICDREGTIVHSTKEGWPGQHISTLASPAAAQAAAYAAHDRQTVSEADSHTAAIAAYPMPLDTDDPLQWVIVVANDLSKPVQSAFEHARTQAMVAASVLGVACLGLWWGLNQFITRRMRQLLENTRLVKSGTPIPQALSGSDEFAEISRAIRESQERFQQLADNVDDLFFIFTPDRQVLYVNPAYEKVWQRSIKRLMEDPLSWREYVEEEYLHVLEHAMDPLFKGERMAQCQYRIKHPDGSLRWIEGRLFPVKNATGEVYRIAALARDVTDQKALEQQILAVSERERRSIGHDLHDDLCQRLAAIKLKCELVTDSIRRNQMPPLVQASEISSHIAEATAVCRNIARGLAPVDLEGDGLMAALTKLTRTIEALYELPCFFYCPHSVIVENSNAAVNLYRISQELANNAARHGNSTRIDIRLDMNAEYVRIEVLNDGVSFKDVPESRIGMGLKIIHYRANAIGANVRIVPRTDGVRGTIATCLAPHSSCNPN